MSTFTLGLVLGVCLGVALLRIAQHFAGSWAKRAMRFEEELGRSPEWKHTYYEHGPLKVDEYRRVGDEQDREASKRMSASELRAVSPLETGVDEEEGRTASERPTPDAG